MLQQLPWQMRVDMNCTLISVNYSVFPSLTIAMSCKTQLITSTPTDCVLRDSRDFDSMLSRLNCALDFTL